MIYLLSLIYIYTEVSMVACLQDSGTNFGFIVYFHSALVEAQHVVRDMYFGHVSILGPLPINDTQEAPQWNWLKSQGEPGAVEDDLIFVTSIRSLRNWVLCHFSGISSEYIYIYLIIYI